MLEAMSTMGVALSEKDTNAAELTGMHEALEQDATASKDAKTPPSCPEDTPDP
jgi:hypothetical protein